MTSFLTELLDQLRTLFDPALLGSELGTLLTHLLVGTLVFASFYLVWWMLAPLLRRGIRRTQVDETTASFLQTVFKFVVLTVGAVQALTAAGVQAGAVLGGLGLAGLTLGFAARDALSNLISGLLIYWDRPFVIGDLVEMGGNYGRVERITLRSTRVVTADGRMLAVPNTEIINTTVASYTNFPHLRLDVGVGVGVQESIGRVRRLLLEIVEDDADYMEQPAPQVVVTDLGDYFVGLDLRVWLDDEKRHVEKRNALREAVYEKLTEAGVDMPFETVQLAPHEVSVREAGDRTSEETLRR